MALKIPGAKNIFPHSKEFEQGGGQIRKGMGTIIVALDGSGDTDNIQDAISMLPATGGEVFIKGGTYNISTDILITTSNTTLTGVGYGTIINALDLGAEATHSLIKIGNGTDNVSNIIIQNLKLEGNRTVQTSMYTRNVYSQKMYHSLFDNIWLHGSISSHTMEWIGQSHYNKVSNCFMEGGDIKLTSCDSNMFVNNRIGGVYIVTGGEYLNISSNILTGKVRGTGLLNSVINSNTYDGADAGVQLVDSDKNSITGNTMISVTTDGIKLTTSDGNIISSNNIQNSNKGIDIISGDKNIIIGNICLNNTVSQITDAGTNTHPNGASGTTNLALDDLNIIA